MIAFRWIVGIALAVLGGVFMGFKPSSPVSLAVLVLGATIIGHLVAESKWDQWNEVPPNPAPPAPPPAPAPPPPAPAPLPAVDDAPSAETVAALRAFPATFLTTSGVVLALLTAFNSSTSPSLAIRVASISLAGCIILSIVLAGLLVGSVPATQKTGSLMSLLFNLAWWLLAFGLLNIALALAYRT